MNVTGEPDFRRPINFFGATGFSEPLGIPFQAVDLKKEFGSVIRYFLAEYARGRTPNPCAVCNRDLKFNRLLAFDFNSAMIPDRLSADLLHINRVTQELEPSLASSWETKDGRTYTLQLRRGLRFSQRRNRSSPTAARVRSP